MIQLHPPLSGFPLSCIVLLFIVEATRIFSKSPERVQWARTFLVLAVFIATSAAFFSGYQAGAPLSDAPPLVQDALGLHHAVGRLMLINSILMTIFFFVERRAIHGKGIIEGLYRLTVIIQLGLALWVGSLGGALVFDHGVGVSAAVVTTAR